MNILVTVLWFSVMMTMILISTVTAGLCILVPIVTVILHFIDWLLG